MNYDKDRPSTVCPANPSSGALTVVNHLRSTWEILLAGDGHDDDEDGDDDCDDDVDDDLNKGGVSADGKKAAVR